MSKKTTVVVMDYQHRHTEDSNFAARSALQKTVASGHIGVVSGMV
jgi:hypothetical protein